MLDHMLIIVKVMSGYKFTILIVTRLYMPPIGRTFRMSREITPDHILPAVDDIEKKCVEIKQLIERYAEDDSYRSFYQFYLIDELPAIIFWLNDFKKTALDEPFSLFHLKASAKNLLNFLCNLLFLTEKAENNVDLLSHMNL